MRRIVVVLAGLAAVSPGALARAQTTAPASGPRTWWVCAVETPVSRGVGMRMTLLGPGLRHNIVNNLYLSAFETAGDRGADAYAADFEAFVARSGHQTTSGVPGEATTSACRPHASPQAAVSYTAGLTADVSSGGGTVKLTTNNIFLDWAPTAPVAAAPAIQAAAGPAPAAAAPVSSLGAVFQDVTPQTAQLLGLDPAKGAAVVSVEAAGAAEESGLRRLDIVVEIAGQAVATAGDVPQIISRLRPGFKAPVRVWRAMTMIYLIMEVAPPPVATPAPVEPVPEVAVVPPITTETSTQRQSDAELPSFLTTPEMLSWPDVRAARNAFTPDGRWATKTIGTDFLGAATQTSIAAALPPGMQRSAVESLVGAPYEPVKITPRSRVTVAEYRYMMFDLQRRTRNASILTVWYGADGALGGLQLEIMPVWTW